jgi:hypothetical protein
MSSMHQVAGSMVSPQTFHATCYILPTTATERSL